MRRRLSIATICVLQKLCRKNSVSSCGMRRILMWCFLPVRVPFVVFFVRDGKLVGRESYDIQTGASESPQERVGEFIRLHYGWQSDGPSEFLVSRMPEEADMIAQYLSRLWGRKTEIAVPKRGEKKALLDLAMRDVTTMVDTLEERKKNRREREEKLGRQIHDILSLAGLTAP